MPELLLIMLSARMILCGLRHDYFFTASLMSPALTVFLPACSAYFTASVETCFAYSSSTSFSAAFALSETRSAPACLMSCSIAASGMSLFESCAILNHLEKHDSRSFI